MMFAPDAATDAENAIDVQVSPDPESTAQTDGRRVRMAQQKRSHARLAVDRSSYCTEISEPETR